jgi:hypothetical protein
MPQRAISVSGTNYALDVRPDRLDLRDRVYHPPTLSLPNQWPRDTDVKRLFPAYVEAGLVLDQGEEGACTGFGLAAVVNYLLWTRSLPKGRSTKVPKKFESVSPNMFYDLARFYDEWPGQDYEGSSCRGAMKGWHKHGVCDQSLWSKSIYPAAQPASGKVKKKTNRKPKVSGNVSYTPDAKWPANAAKRPVGVYYRIDKNSVTDMQAAIYDVGAIYVSCAVHAGWSHVKVADSKTLTHASLPRIALQLKQEAEGGHAFALVGFNEDGFVVQNSWGTGWGNAGFAVLAYDDWVQHGTDAWVCALGVPQSRTSRQASAGNATRTASDASLLSGDKPIKVKPINPKAQPWSTANALQHSIVAGNDGEVVISRPDQATPKISVAHVVKLFEDWAKAWQKQNTGKAPKLVIYAHGGLNSEASAIERARILGPYFQENGIYPIFYIWKTGFLEVLRQEASDQLPTEPSQAHATGAFANARDRLLEALANGPFRFMWRQMKQNAFAAKDSDRALGLLHKCLQDVEVRMPFETHLVAHSAGSFVAGHLLDLGRQATSLSLFAPACSLEFALDKFSGKAPLGKTSLHLLNAEAEQKDPTGWKPPLAYGKSLLWLVSRGFEEKRKTPLAGFAHCLDSQATEKDDDLWREEYYSHVAEWRKWVGTLKPLPDGRSPVQFTASHRVTSAGKAVAGSHGGFDNDVDVMNRTISLINGDGSVEPPVPVEDLDY